jgi:hypothetical protein
MATRITDRDEEEDRPAKKKKKRQKAPASPAIFIIGGVAAFVVLLAVGGLLAYVLIPPRKPAEVEQAKVEEKKKEKEENKEQKGVEEDPPAKKGGKAIGRGSRGAAYITERKSELKQLGLVFTQFSDDYKGAARTKENFLAYIKRDFGPIHDYVKDGYYQMNMKARLQGGDIIAYERDEYDQGYLAVRSNGDVDFVPAVQFRKEMDLK